MHLCKDCKYCGLPGSLEYAECRHPKNIRLNVVSGTTSPKYVLCSSHRDDGPIASRVFGTCAIAARWFEPK